ncbi:hypothetical protein ACSQ6I_28265 [Anabaena sp. WFMT]|uniref:hypothetical protein n=1 Tax=Anabaena sp. WFMT TaxID=3449730 RepID=UPI003F281B06
MLTTIAKRIQSRLTRQGVKVVLGEIKEQCDRLIPDIDNPTDQEVLSVVDHFLSTATKLTVVNEDIATEELTEVEETSICVGGELGNIATSTQTDLETLETEQETTEVDNGIQLVNSNLDTNLDDIDSQYLHPTTAAPTTEDVGAIAPIVDIAPLATATNSELVSSTAHSLGITLNTAEIELIAENINTSSDDLTDSLDEIKGAIIAFVRHRIATNSQKIGEALEEISQVAADGFNQNSEQLSTGLQGINSQLQQQSTDFKSKVRSTLKAFAIPAIKAG